MADYGTVIDAAKRGARIALAEAKVIEVFRSFNETATDDETEGDELADNVRRALDLLHPVDAERDMSEDEAVVNAQTAARGTREELFNAHAEIRDACKALAEVTGIDSGGLAGHVEAMIEHVTCTHIEVERISTELQSERVAGREAQMRAERVEQDARTVRNVLTSVASERDEARAEIERLRAELAATAEPIATDEPQQDAEWEPGPWWSRHPVAREHYIASRGLAFASGYVWSNGDIWNARVVAFGYPCVTYDCDPFDSMKSAVEWCEGHVWLKRDIDILRDEHRADVTEHEPAQPEPAQEAEPSDAAPAPDTDLVVIGYGDGVEVGP